MSNTDFDIIYKKSYELAETLIQSAVGDELLKKFHIYSNFITQLIQILNSMQEKDEHVISETKNLLAMHKKVIDCLINEKGTISNNITSKIRKEHIQQKYYAESLKSAILNKKV